VPVAAQRGRASAALDLATSRVIGAVSCCLIRAPPLLATGAASGARFVVSCGVGGQKWERVSRSGR
jgi:hypothetical protein